MTNWTEHTAPHPDLHAPTREPISPETSPSTPEAEGPATAAVVGAPEAPSAEPRRPRRRWPRIVALAVPFLLVGAALGVAGGYRSTTPTRDRLRGERDDLQTQLDQAHDDLAAANTAATASRTKSDACQRLATDSKVMADDFDQLTKLWDDPAYQNSAPGSPEEAAMFKKEYDIVTSMTFTRGLVTSDVQACTSTATTT